MRWSATSFYQPLDVSQRFFIEPRAAYSVQYENIFFDDERVARYRFNDAIGQLEFGANAGRYAQARIGYMYDLRKVMVDVGSPLLSESSPHDAGVTLTAQYDSRDTAFAPTHGVTAALEYMNASESLGSDRNWQRAELGLGVAVPFRRNIWWITAAGGSGIGGDLPADRAFTLGGPNSFPGLRAE